MVKRLIIIVIVLLLLGTGAAQAVSQTEIRYLEILRDNARIRYFSDIVCFSVEFSISILAARE